MRDRWQKVSQLYHDALARDASERASFLRDACADDEVLRREVESLLAHEETAAGFLATLPREPAARSATDASEPSLIGRRIGPYRITSFLGSGGMGEVYRARDVKLGRDVAIKILPKAFELDADRRTRFEREARLLAALNHPHIGAIYGFEEADGICALALELVEGPTLADRLSHGAIPVAEALSVARQIVEALEAAHEKGIVHRDLKPANIKVSPDGPLKLLDFGLARVFAADGSSQDLSQLPTVTFEGTREGVVGGTPGYMSPEQARAKPLDKRTDIWAFGCVLYEMLSGRPAFTKDTLSDTIAAVLEGEPDWGALPAAAPHNVRRLLRRCLEKDQKRRLRDIGDARIELDDVSAPAPVNLAPVHAPGVYRVGRIRIAGFVLIVATAVTGVVAYLRTMPPEVPTYRASILPPAGVNWSSAIPATRFAISPDGRRLAFVATGIDGRTLLWVRPLDALEAQPLGGTEGAAMPFWSPDSRFIGFSAQGELKRIEASGGTPVVLADTGVNNNAAWSRDGVIVFLPPVVGPLFRVSADGGEPTQATTLDAASGDSVHWTPSFLPDGRHFLYCVVGNKPGEPLNARAVYVGSLDPSEGSWLLLEGGSNAKYAQGHVLFMRGPTLMAQRFDVDRLQLTGEAVPIAEPVDIGGASGRTGAFSVSETGLLAYQSPVASGTFRSQLTWFDRKGNKVATFEDQADFVDIALSPDGARVAATLRDSSSRAMDIWLVDGARGVRTRLTFDPADELNAVWSPDGNRIAFTSNRRLPVELYQKASNGTGGEDRVPTENFGNRVPLSWSPDGRHILYMNGNSLWVAPQFGDLKPLAVLHSTGGIQAAQFSPDGRWIAYASNESGRYEIYVVPFHESGGSRGEIPAGTGSKWQVSTAGGNWPRWRRDGGELFYLAPDNALMAVAVSGQDADFNAGPSERLFPIHVRLLQTGGLIDSLYNYDASPDGQRFLVNTPADTAAPAPINLVFNWAAGLKN